MDRDTLRRQWPKAYDVEDVHALVAKAIHDQLRTWGATLDEFELEDALADGIANSWELALSYDESRGNTFSNYVYGYVRLRLASWYRKRKPGARYATPPEHVSLDATGPDGTTTIGDRLESVIGTGESDATANRDPYFTRAINEGPSSADRAITLLDSFPLESPPRRARRSRASETRGERKAA